MSISVSQLLKMSRAERGELYRKSDAGPIPDGEGRGTAVIGPDSVARRIIAWIARALFWQGKVFDAKRGLLINRVFCLSFKAIKARIYKDSSWLDQRECVILDYSQTSLVACKVRDEMREVAPGLYLGIVFWGRTRLPVEFIVDVNPRDARGWGLAVRYALFLLALGVLGFWIASMTMQP